MVTLFNQERVTEIHEYNLVKDARHEGRKEDQQEGLERGIRATVLTLKESRSCRRRWSKVLGDPGLRISDALAQNLIDDKGDVIGVLDDNGIVIEDGLSGAAAECRR